MSLINFNFAHLILWLTRHQKYISVPIIVKGVQTVEDVELCVKAGVQGVLIVGLFFFTSFLHMRFC